MKQQVLKPEQVSGRHYLTLLLYSACLKSCDVTMNRRASSGECTSVHHKPFELSARAIQGANAVPEANFSLELHRIESVDSAVRADIYVESQQPLSEAFIELHFDPARFNPEETYISDLLGEKDQRLELLISDKAGRIDLGVVSLPGAQSIPRAMPARSLLASLTFAGEPQDSVDREAQAFQGKPTYRTSAF